MNKFFVENDCIDDEEIEGIKDLEVLEVDDVTFKVLSAYKKNYARQKAELRQLREYKQRELSAFAIGDAVSDGICIVDNKGIVTAINKGYTEITGIKEKEVIGENIQLLLDKGYFNNAVSLLVIEQKKKITMLSTINNNKKKVLITGNPFFNDKGEVTHVLTVMRDLTELLKLRDKLESVEKKSEKYLHELNYYRNKKGKHVNIIGESTKMMELKEIVSYVAKTAATILITGETGCGKEVVSKEIHDRSNRKNEPYIKVNCAAIPDSLIESELFGYEKGAFTGAQNKEKLGMFELANGGTILLDEIGEMPLSLQSKLLRVLQEKELMRVGGVKSIKLDVRVIASTNQILSELIKQGKFREDLFYRLNVVPIRIPPLRERKADISIFANEFLEKFNLKYSKEKSFGDMAISAFEQYDWPGNVRELQNVIERLLVVDDEKYITYTHIINIIGNNKPEIHFTDHALTLREAVDALEKEMIELALKNYGSTYKAAKVLGVTQPTVFRKAKALGVRLNNA
ncbi:sigma-54 interaction domain-containing protein [Clostridium estertheticum]|uniref:HTH-type transcriptional regulatory protein TyrR n=1 Tax=Clostridium estertheticum TaxID=238834 RepID=A0AA47EM77_9CLOT|nr:sigma 54-interacting transcriptional regulator [Clostridium estertheticum]MBU3156644.1 sigma 54-interacting transcriptional regulator [Clostridium estertheticum]WAG62776.1 sigma 54-interacting transcriptional regulator [Clostridium estertheticum]